MSLRNQLLLLLLTPLLPLLLLYGVRSYYTAYDFVNQAYDGTLFRTARALAQQIRISDGQLKVVLKRQAREMLEYDRDGKVYYKITGPKGEFIVGFEKLPGPPGYPVPNETTYYDSWFEDQPVRVAAYYLSLNEDKLTGTMTVQVAETVGKRKLLIDRVLMDRLLPLVGVMLLLILIVLWGVKSGLAPLGRLRKELNQRSNRDLSPLPADTAPHELRPFIQAINDLMARLATAIEQQQRFIADASHQLRTPIAGLKAQTELVLKEHNPEVIRHSLRQILQSAERTAHLVNQLLTMARIEPGSQRPLNLTIMDLNTVAQTATSFWVPKALAKQIDLGFESPEAPLKIKGDVFFITEMLNNLIDNAIRYTQAGGVITVRTRSEGEQVLLEIEDDGPGIPEIEREKVFGRFYRVSGNSQDGCGLGLAIVHEIATAHQARVAINDGAGGQGSKFVIGFAKAE